MKNSGKFKLAVGLRDECCFCGIFPVLPGWLVGIYVIREISSQEVRVQSTLPTPPQLRAAEPASSAMLENVALSYSYHSIPEM